MGEQNLFLQAKTIAMSSMVPAFVGLFTEHGDKS